MTTSYSAMAHGLLRIVAGLLFMFHGLVKIFGFPPGAQPGQVPPLSLMGVGGAIELVAGALIMIGLFSRTAAFIASGEMAVAYWMFHAPQGLYPVAEPGRRGDPLLLHLPVHRRRRAGRVERRRDARGQGGPLGRRQGWTLESAARASPPPAPRPGPSPRCGCRRSCPIRSRSDSDRRGRRSPASVSPGARPFRGPDQARILDRDGLDPFGRDHARDPRHVVERAPRRHRRGGHQQRAGSGHPHRPRRRSGDCWSAAARAGRRREPGAIDDERDERARQRPEDHRGREIRAHRISSLSRPDRARSGSWSAHSPACGRKRGRAAA